MAILKISASLIKQNWRIWGRILNLCSLFFFSSILACSFSYATLSFRSSLVMDESKGKILYSKNPNLRLPPASTTKLMTAILTVEKENLSKLVTVSKRAAQANPVKIGLEAGDKLTVEDLLYATLLKSANDAAIALAETVAGSEKEFVELMNKKAKFLGLKNTKFINATGLPGPGQYTSAADLAKLMSYALNYPKIKEILETPEAKIITQEGKIFLLHTTNKLLASPEKIIGKTGFTHRAGHCFVGAVKKETENIIFAILGSGNRRTLWQEAKKLISSGYIGQNGGAKNIFSKPKFSFGQRL